MAEQIQFNDGTAYERYMGAWSQLAGDAFLDWLAPPPRLRWLDVGCGNGAFTEMVVERCSPASVHGIDPSEAQLAYARARFGKGSVAFQQGDAMAMPFDDNAFDAAVMPLVIFFVPDAAKGVSEMARVASPGGIVAAYAWDMAGGGFPYALLLDTLRGMGVAVPEPPSVDAARIDHLRELWTGAGLHSLETREITVRRRFAGFTDYWETILGAASVGRKVATLAAAEIRILQGRLIDGLTAGPDGVITITARANAIKGRK